MINTKDFVLLAGEPGYWDAAALAVVDCGVLTLSEMQKNQYAAGRRSAQLVRGMYGWYVRLVTSFSDRQILANTSEHGGKLDGSLEDALRWGRHWANCDPANREFFARRSDLEETAVQS